MADNLDETIVQNLLQEVAGRMNEAALISRTADEYGRQGLGGRAFKTLLTIEPMIHDVNTLINAASIIRRRGPPQLRRLMT